MTAFQARSSEALPANSSSFLEIAKTEADRVRRAAEGLAREDGPPDERDGEGAPGGVRRRHPASEHACEHAGAPRLETGNLVKALRTPHVRGRWGEVQLRNVVEAGRPARPTATSRSRLTATHEDGLLRPDLSSGSRAEKVVIVDAKAPLAAYLDAMRGKDDESRAAHLAVHARQVRDHMAKLAQKRYCRQFGDIAGLRVMFLPDEALLPRRPGAGRVARRDGGGSASSSPRRRRCSCCSGRSPATGSRRAWPRAPARSTSSGGSSTCASGSWVAISTSRQRARQRRQALQRHGRLAREAPARPGAAVRGARSRPTWAPAADRAPALQQPQAPELAELGEQLRAIDAA